jgi:hypothetical protein
MFDRFMNPFDGSRRRKQQVHGKKSKEEYFERQRALEEYLLENSPTGDAPGDEGGKRYPKSKNNRKRL